MLSIETKSHAGRIRVDTIDERMLRQAYAQSKYVERLVDHPVSPLLVFSRAYLDRPVSNRRGVLVLPARLLERHVVRRTASLAKAEVMTLAPGSRDGGGRALERFHCGLTSRSADRRLGAAVMWRVVQSEDCLLHESDSRWRIRAEGARTHSAWLIDLRVRPAVAIADLVVRALDCGIRPVLEAVAQRGSVRRAYDSFVMAQNFLS